MRSVLRLATWALLALTLEAALLTFSTLEHARASSGCTGQTTYFDGAHSSRTDHISVRAQVNTMDPALCSPGYDQYSYSTVWVMTQSASNDYMYAQSGYGRAISTTGTTRFYAEARQNYAAGYTRRWSPETVTGSHIYKVRYAAPAHLTKMKHDNTVLLRTETFDPVQAWGPTSTWMYEFFGEVHDPGDDIAGTPANPVVFSSMQYLPCAGCNWLTPPALTTRNDRTCRYGLSYDSTSNPSQLSIWTKSPSTCPSSPQ